MRMKIYSFVLLLSFLTTSSYGNEDVVKDADTAKKEIKEAMEKMSPDEQAQFRNMLMAFGGASLTEEFKTLSEKEITDILNNPNSDASALRKIAKTIEYSQKPLPNSSKILQQILNNPKSDGYTYAAVADAIGNVGMNSQSKIEGAESMLQQIIDSSKANKETIMSVSMVINVSTPDFKMQLAQKILNSPNVSGIALKYLIGNISSLREEDEDKLLIQITSSHAIDGNTLTQLFHYIENSQKPIKSLDKLVQTIINSPKAQVSELNNLVHALKKSIIPTSKTNELFQQIIASPKSEGSTLAAVIYSQDYLNQPVGMEKMLQQALNSKKANADTFTAIVTFIGNSKKIAYSDKMIIQILESPLSDKGTLKTIEYIVQRSKHKIENADAILQSVKELLK